MYPDTLFHVIKSLSMETNLHITNFNPVRVYLLQQNLASVGNMVVWCVSTLQNVLCTCWFVYKCKHVYKWGFMSRVHQWKEVLQGVENVEKMWSKIFHPHPTLPHPSQSTLNQHYVSWWIDRSRCGNQENDVIWLFLILLKTDVALGTLLILLLMNFSKRYDFSVRFAPYFILNSSHMCVFWYIGDAHRRWKYDGRRETLIRSQRPACQSAHVGKRTGA